MDELLTLKKCTKCGEEKDRSAFHARADSDDGLRSYCKKCRNKYAAAYCQKNSEHVKQYHVDYKKLPHAKVARAISDRRYRREHRMALSAHKKVGRAVRDGVLIRPEACSLCGKICKIEGHHGDYSQPLDVQWVCQACHSQIHKDLRDGP